MVEYLINHNADINAKNRNDWTPLHYAAKYDRLSIVEYLVNHKADINAINNDSKTPLGESTELKILEFLKSKGGQ